MARRSSRTATVISTTGRIAQRRADRRRDRSPRSARPARSAAPRTAPTRVIDATGKYVDPRRHRRAHAHGAAVRRHRSPATRSRPAPAPRRGAASRPSSTSPCSAPARTCSGRPRRVAPQGRRRVRHRLRVPPDHRRRRRRVAEGDDVPRRARGHHQLQAVHGLPRRLLQRRRPDPAGHADGRRVRGDDHDARRERHRHRRAGAAGAGPRRDRPEVPQLHPARRRSRPRPPTGRSCSATWPATCRSTSCTCRPATPSNEVAAARHHGRNVFAETCPQYLYLTLEETLGKPGFEGAKWVCSHAGALTDHDPTTSADGPRSPGRPVEGPAHERAGRRVAPTTARSA